MTAITIEEAEQVTSGSRWRPSPARLARLLLGLTIFGIGDALLIDSLLGNSPWTVFAQGIAVQTPISVGAATIATSFGVLLLWIPLGQRPGLGTILNAILVGLAIDATLHVLSGHAPLAVRVAEVLAGIAIVGVGSGLYLSAALGPGPRDGLMTGLHRLTGRPVALVRTAIELSALVVGVLLGGRFGIGTIAFALLIGPAVALGLKVAGVTRPDTL
jgi:hypothetical protein